MREYTPDTLATVFPDAIARLGAWVESEVKSGRYSEDGEIQMRLVLGVLSDASKYMEEDIEAHVSAWRASLH